LKKRDRRLTITQADLLKIVFFCNDAFYCI
jgi:hypothetical protein